MISPKIAEIEIPAFFLARLAKNGLGPFRRTAETAAREMATEITLEDAVRDCRFVDGSIANVACILRIVADTNNTWFWVAVEHGIVRADAEDEALRKAYSDDATAGADDHFWAP